MPYTARYAGHNRAGRPSSGRSRHRSAVLTRTVRRVAGLGLALLVALALSGCVAVQLKATVHSNNTVSGTSRVGFSKSLATLAGGSAALLDSLKAQRPCAFAGSSATAKTYDDGSFIGLECAFGGLSLQQFNSGTTGLRLDRVGNRFELTGSFSLTDRLGQLPGLSGGGALPSGLPTDLSSLLPSGLPTDLSSLLPSGLPTDLSSLLPPGGGSLPALDPTQILRTAKISFEFTFPGKVNSSTGKVRGRTVTFVPDANGNIDFRTVATATPSSTGIGTTGWAGLAALLLVLLGLVWLIARRRHGTAMAGHGVPGPVSFGPGPYPGQPYPGQPYPGQPYPGQPYPGQPYPGQPYQPQPPGQPYPTQSYPGQPYPPQPHPGQSGPPQADPGRAAEPGPTEPYSGPPSWRPPQPGE